MPPSSSPKAPAPKDPPQPPKLVLHHPQTGESWPLPAPATDPKQPSGPPQPSSFVVLPRGAKRESLTILDNRTGVVREVPIEHNAVDATHFMELHAPGDGEPLRVYDPSFQNTAVTKSAICYLDGDKGVLRYRGYAIEELAEKSTFLETAFLLIYGDLPTEAQLKEWNHQIMRHTFLHFQVSQLMKSFNYDAHPMGMFTSVMAAMSTFHPEANPSLTNTELYSRDEKIRNQQIHRILGKAATVAACSYRHRIGRDYNQPRNDLSYTENFLFMMDHLSEENYKPNRVLSKALDVLFILHAEHELNNSTAAMRHISSTKVDPYSAISGASASLYGPLHGGACEAVLRMLEEIGTKENIPAFLESVKTKSRKISGFGHRVYKTYDPRARIIKQTAYSVFEVVGKEPLIDLAIHLEQAALQDPYFIERKLYPNVDFYSGLIYRSMGFPTDFFPVLFAIPRVAGWLAHWNEAIADKSAKIWRPRQIYVGAPSRSYVPPEYRRNDIKLSPAYINPNSKRSRVASWASKL